MVPSVELMPYAPEIPLDQRTLDQPSRETAAEQLSHPMASNEVSPSAEEAPSEPGTGPTVPATTEEKAFQAEVVGSASDSALVSGTEVEAPNTDGADTHDTQTANHSKATVSISSTHMITLEEEQMTRAEAAEISPPAGEDSTATAAEHNPTETTVASSETTDAREIAAGQENTQDKKNASTESQQTENQPVGLASDDHESGKST
jgi:hypothetical protein